MIAIYCLFGILMQMATLRCAEADPCVVNKPLGKMGIRGTKCSVLGKASCDRLIDGGWYRASYKGVPMDIPTICVNPGLCGTTFPIWMNGKLPAVADGIVHREACVRGLVGGDCCIRRYNISVKNCGLYNVYNLPYTEACDEAYCFGDHDCEGTVTESSSLVHKASTSTTTSSPTSTNSAKDQVISPCPACEHSTDIVMMVAASLCSAVVGGLTTFMAMLKWNGTNRGKVFFTDPRGKTETPFSYVFTSRDESIKGPTQYSAEGIPRKALTAFHK